MSPERQRIAIAEFVFPNLEWEADGPNDLPNPSRAGWFYDGSGNYGTTLPDYLNDLNAISAAEKSLEKYDQASYTMNLRRIVVRDMDSTQNQDPDTGTLLDIHFYGSASAQRAEAFLKTIGKWEDGQ